MDAAFVGDDGVEADFADGAAEVTRKVAVSMGVFGPDVWAGGWVDEVNATGGKPRMLPGVYLKKD